MSLKLNVTHYTINIKKEKKILDSKIIPPIYSEYLNLPKPNKASNSGRVFDKEKKIDVGKLQSPLYLKYSNIIIKNNLRDIGLQNLDVIDDSNNVLSNPVKKIKKFGKIFNNVLDTNNLISSRKITFNNSHNLRIKNEKNSIFDKNKVYPYNMNENQIFEMFLNIHKKTDSELNDLDYKIAVKIDKRTYFQYYLSLIRTKHLLFFSFCPSFDYNSQIIKIFLFFFNFIFSFFVNALFFDDDTMHKIYEEKGTFDFIYNIPQTLCSSLTSGFIGTIIENLALTNSNFINLKEKINNKIIINQKKETLRAIKIKILLFFLLTLFLLVIFWFYLSCF